MDIEAKTESAIPEAPDLAGVEGRIEQLLQDLEPLARAVAHRWARDCLDVEDDLAQEARIVIWQLLKKRPDTPRSYLARAVKYHILDERKRGKSVDGRLDPTSARSRSWVVVSLDSVEAPGSVDALARSHPGRHDAWRSPTEEDAVGRIVYQELRRTLSLREDVYLSLLLMGYRHKDAGEVLGLTQKQVGYIQQVLMRKLTAVLEGREDRDTPSSQSVAAQKAARARWDKRPFQVPKDIQAVLEWLTEGE